MSDDQFKDLEVKLNIKNKKEETNIIHFEKKEIHSNDDHRIDIKSDYIKSRQEIINDIEMSTQVADRLREAIENSDVDNDKFLARKTEVFTQLIRCNIDLRKELFELHKAKKNLLEEPVINQEDQEGKKLTTSQIKELLHDNKRQLF